MASPNKLKNLLFNCYRSGASRPIGAPIMRRPVSSGGALSKVFHPTTLSKPPCGSIISRSSTAMQQPTAKPKSHSYSYLNNANVVNATLLSRKFSTKVEDIVHIENDVSKLLQLEASKDETELAKLEQQKNALISKGYKILENANQVELSREAHGRSIKITWDPRIRVKNKEEVEEDEFLEEEKAASEEASEGEEYEDDEDDEFQSEESSQTQLDVKLEINNGKKILVAYCGIGYDNLLYVYSLSGINDTQVEMDTLPNELQHRIYDYVEELGIGDKTASFIRQYNQYHQISSNVKGICDIVNYFESK